MRYKFLLIIFFITLMFCGLASASSVNTTQNQTNYTYSISSVPSNDYNLGHPVLTDIYVDPVVGNDSNRGTEPSKPLRTFNEAWNHVPQSQILNQTGFRIMLMPGNYTETNLPANGWMESRFGTFNYPIIIQSANNTKKANIKTSDIFNLYNCRYVYLIGLNFESNANNVIHLEKCDHILIKNVTIKGTGSIDDYSAPQEDLKANQCQNIFLEDSEIYNAWNVPVDFVAVRNGHILRNEIHGSGDWCIYLKGGSSHFLISGNKIYNAKNGGFSAGQGTGFEYMVSPYIHYETYDLKFVNNIIHDTDGAGMGVSGSYNILLAYNTLYRVGNNSHALEFGHGIRSCVGDSSKCQEYLASGGWGTAHPGTNERIPNKNVFVYNNIIYNPTGYQSQWSHFSLANPVIPTTGSNIPSPSRADDNLVIKGNILWNGPYNLPIGIEGMNTLLTMSQLKNQNYINTLKPQLINPDIGNFRPPNGGNVFKATVYTIPSFLGNDAPIKPQIDAGNLTNLIYWDYDLNMRYISSPPGAFAYSFADVINPTVTFTNPSNNTLNVPINKVIKITFNRAIKAGNYYIELKNSNGTSLHLSKTIAGNTLTLTPWNNLTRGTKYTIILHTGCITDLSGNPLAAYITSFTTSTDATPPTVTTSDSSNNAVNVARSKQIKITFSEPLKWSNWWIELKNNIGTVIPITKSITGNVLTITPSTLLSANTKFIIGIHTGSVTDFAGNPLVGFTRSFTTSVV